MMKLTEREPRKVYLERFVIMALLLIPSVFLQGVRSALVAVLSVLSCMIIDAVCCFFRKKRYNIKDSAVPFWGLAAAMMMPATVPVGLILLSSLICIVIGKHLFGDSDNIIFCPPAISTAFLLICYPAEMLYFPKYGEKVALFGEYTGAVSRSIDYSLNLHSVPSQSLGDAMMGLVSGPVGAVFTGIILVCGICMAFRRSSSGAVIAPCVFTAGLLAFFFPRAGISGFQSIVYELSSGYLAFGMVFLAAEPYRIPQKTVGKILYGIMLGCTTMMFRFFGQTEGSCIFAILILGALCSSFDRVVENVVYWKKNYLNTFEKSKTNIQSGTVKLTDTQEIVLPEKYRYNTPPIDSKITKIRRTRKNDEQTENDEDKSEQKTTLSFVAKLKNARKKSEDNSENNDNAADGTAVNNGELPSPDKETSETVNEEDKENEQK